MDARLYILIVRFKNNYYKKLKVPTKQNTS